MARGERKWRNSGVRPEATVPGPELGSRRKPPGQAPGSSRPRRRPAVRRPMPFGGWSSRSGSRHDSRTTMRAARQVLGRASVTTCSPRAAHTPCRWSAGMSTWRRCSRVERTRRVRGVRIRHTGATTVSRRRPRCDADWLDARSGGDDETLRGIRHRAGDRPRLGLACPRTRAHEPVHDLDDSFKERAIVSLTMLAQAANLVIRDTRSARVDFC